MATPLERLDQIRDALVNQGIGGSRLAQQKIERQNLATLQGSLGESQATRAREGQRKASSLLKQSIESRKFATPSGGRGSSNRPTSPQLTIKNLSAPADGGFGQGANGNPAASKNRFELQIPGAGTSQNFESIEELLADLQKRGLSADNLVFEGPGNTTPDLIKTLERNKIRQVAAPEPKGLSSFFNSLRSVAGSGGARRTNTEEPTRRNSLRDVLGNLGGGRSTQNEIVTSAGVGTRLFDTIGRASERPAQKQPSAREAQLRQQAEARIAAGADPVAVNTRLQELLGGL